MSAVLVIRAARPGDEEAILGALREFAEFEKLTHSFRLTAEIVARDFIGGDRRVECDVAEWGGTFAGVMIWFRTYATFSATPVLYIEDIFVLPEFRSRGIATAFFRHLARQAMREGAAQIQWRVLDWNARAVTFYAGLGAPVLQDWRFCSLQGGALAALAAS